MRQKKPAPSLILLVITGLFMWWGQVLGSGNKYIPDTSRISPSEIVKDNPIVSLLDSLSRLHVKHIWDIPSDRSALNIYNYPVDFVPNFSDSVYIERLKRLKKETPFEFVYNPLVRQYIELYACRKRDLTQRIMGLAKIYFPLFEEQLDRFNMPLELKYLAVIESALNPAACSSAKAKGLWQFMAGTGKMYDLKVNALVDDRADPYKATVAACRHMKDLFSLYGDWALVLAAYNSGAGNVNRAIKKAGGIKDYWVVQKFLPRETRDYVPAFIAVNYVLNYATEHNLYPVYPGIGANDIDTVTINQVLTFEQISGMFNIPVENIKYLNPAYTRDIIPGSAATPYILRLPKNYIADFINNEAAVYAYRSKGDSGKSKFTEKTLELQKNMITHVVKKGETMASIAQKYNCTVSDIKKWNLIKKGNVKPRQEILVYNKSYIKPQKGDLSGKLKSNREPVSSVVSKALIGPVADSLSMAACSERKSVKTDEKYIYHTIRQGDTLWEIANRYKTNIEQLKVMNGIKDDKGLKPGAKIKVAFEG